MLLGPADAGPAVLARGAGSQASRSSIASCSPPGPPSPLSSANSPVRCSSSQPRTSARKPRPRRSSSGPQSGSLPSNCLVARRTPWPTTLRGAARRRGAFGDQPGVRRGSIDPHLRRAARAGARRPRRGYAAPGLEPGRPRRASGRRTASTGWSPRLAVSYAGGALVPLNSRYTGHEVADVVDRDGRGSWWSPTGSWAATRSPTCARPATWPPVSRGRRRSSATWADRSATDASRRRRGASPTRSSPDDVADILFTSGTTGRPKGAMSAHRQTIGVARRLGRARRRHARTTATWWSTRSSTPSATRSASSSACSPAPRSTRWRPSTSTRRCG